MKTVNEINRGLLSQIRVLWKYLLINYYIPAFVVLLGALRIMQSNPAITAEVLFRDITAITNVSFYFGFVSQLGLILWSAAATACLLALYLLNGFGSISSKTRRLLLTSGLLSIFLLFDDMFLIHEEVIPNILNYGQTRVYVGYLVLFALFLYFNRSELLTSAYLPILMAAVLFFASIALDVFVDRFYERGLHNAWFDTYETFIEDGLKFLGITSWLAYFLRYIHFKFTPLYERPE